MAEGFLGRWSQRKQAVREGKAALETPASGHSPLPEPSPQPSASGSGSSSQAGNSQGSLLPLTPSPLGGEGRGEGFATAPEAAPAPGPTLADVQRLTAESDFKPFVARTVSPEVRNAALKKLFADPHYKLMDRLDTYIDDYSKPDPLPESMLRQMVGAKFLKLFDRVEENDRQSKAGDAPREDAHSLVDKCVAQSLPAQQSPARPVTIGTGPLRNKQPENSGTDHDHTDLQLQPNHAAGRRKPGRSAE